MIFISVVGLTGCGQKIGEEHKFKNDDEKIISLEKQLYDVNLIDSKFTWYSEYIIDFVESSKVNNYEISSEKVNEQIKNVQNKIELINSLDEKLIKKAIDSEVKKNVKKEDTDKNKEYIRDSNKYKKNIPNNIKQMKVILNKIIHNLELGKDGNYDKNDLKIIRESQKEIIKLYDNEVK